MELKDYLHYYIGCRVQAAPYGGQQKRYEYGKLVGIGIHDVVNIKFDTWQSVADVSTFCVKPILRQLEDMTEGEAVMVHREATKTPFLPADKDEYDVTYIKDKGEVCSIQVIDLRMPTIYTNINIEGDVLVYVHEVNEEPKICERVANQHHITHYLLRQGFDLFGLIDAGLAIDAKTVKQ